MFVFSTFSGDNNYWVKIVQWYIWWVYNLTLLLFFYKGVKQGHPLGLLSQDRPSGSINLRIGGASSPRGPKPLKVHPTSTPFQINEKEVLPLSRILGRRLGGEQWCQAGTACSAVHNPICYCVFNFFPKCQYVYFCFVYTAMFLFCFQRYHSITCKPASKKL